MAEGPERKWQSVVNHAWRCSACGWLLWDTLMPDDLSAECSNCETIKALRERVEKAEADRLHHAERVFKAIAEHIQEPGTFRYLIYDRLGFGPEAYQPLYLAGGMAISNICTEVDELREKLAEAEQEVADSEAYKDSCWAAKERAEREAAQLRTKLAEAEADTRQMREAIESAHQTLSDYFGHADAEYQPAALEAISTLHAAMQEDSQWACPCDYMNVGPVCTKCGRLRGDS